MTPPIAIEPIVQKDINDCGIAALAMLLGHPYREVSEVALSVVSKTVHKSGMWATDIRRIAKALGVKMYTKKVLPEDGTGLLAVCRPGEHHLTVMFQGVVINPADGLIWDYDAYLARGKWEFHSFMECE